MFQYVEETSQEKWQIAWKSPAYRKKVIAGIVIIFIILALFPFFFQLIEKREGILIHDGFLDLIPAYNVSVFVFLIIWAIAILTLRRAIQDPDILLNFLWSYILLCLVRMLTITLVPLNPPEHLIPMMDPISNSFYGARFITKDLFFSGHTATVFLMFLCLKKRTDRLLALVGSTITGILLLIQHVHYTIDILAAPVFSYFIFITARALMGTGRKENLGKNKG
jgi:PAP2 superfamily C-terminal